MREKAVMLDGYARIDLFSAHSLSIYNISRRVAISREGLKQQNWEDQGVTTVDLTPSWQRFSSLPINIQQQSYRGHITCFEYSAKNVAIATVAF